MWGHSRRFRQPERTLTDSVHASLEFAAGSPIDATASHSPSEAVRPAAPEVTVAARDSGHEETAVNDELTCDKRCVHRITGRVGIACVGATTPGLTGSRAERGGTPSGNGSGTKLFTVAASAEAHREVLRQALGVTG